MAGVPFYLRTGKRLAKRTTEIMIQFRCAPHIVFREREVEPNRLILNIHPIEGISVSFGAKRPGTEMSIGNVTDELQLSRRVCGVTRSAYATLLNDCVRGDATLFDRGDSVEAAWSLIDPSRCLERGQDRHRAAIFCGSWGPRNPIYCSSATIEKWYNP